MIKTPGTKKPEESKELEKPKESGKTKEQTKKKFPVIVIIILLLVAAGFIVYRFVFSKVRNKISDILISETISDQIEGDVKIEDEGEKITYEGEDFEFSYDTDSDLPDNFPKDFPVYKNAQLISKWSSESEEDMGLSIMWETDDELKKVAEYYKTELLKNNWETISTYEQEDSFVYTLEKDTKECLLGITEAEDKTNISATFNDI